MTIDISDFYLNTPLPGKEYTRIPVKLIPACIREQYQLARLKHNGFVYVEISEGMYRLPQSGILASDRLQAHLLEHGYKQAAHTPGLFNHETRPVTFSLIADDFGVKYVGEDHAQHLIATLQLLYHITIDWTHISIPGYMNKALARFQSPPPK